MTDFNYTIVVQITIYAAAILAVFVLPFMCNVEKCRYLCKANKNVGEYVIMQGCYCRNSENPRDSR